MPDFSAPEYASYVALMRELAFEHEFQSGDWALEIVTVSGDQTRTWPMDREAARFWQKAYPKFERRGLPWIYWLPTSDDWDQMLEAAGCRTYCMTRLANGEYQAGTLNGPFANASSRLEAKARLWMEITGRVALDA